MGARSKYHQSVARLTHMAATLLRRADARAESQLVVRQTRARPDNKNYQLWCAVSPGYGWLVAARCMVGLGEASFINLAAPFINAVAPRESRSAWLAIFYATIPVGIALGYAYGGLVTGQLGLSWRWALAIQAIIMAPFAVVCLVQGARGVGMGRGRIAYLIIDLLLLPQKERHLLLLLLLEPQ